jgi:hypothetical protein
MRPALAQERTPDLTVTLHDVAGAPIGGVTVVVRDESGTRDVARATTDAAGIATFSGLTEGQVRIATIGVLPDGTRLYQPGNDAQGIFLLVDPGPTTLELRSEIDGMIVPDPASMAAREPGVPIATAAVVIPTAPIATRSSIVQDAVSHLQAPGQADTVAPAFALDSDATMNGRNPQSPPLWLGVLLLLLIIGVGIVIVILQRRWRAM